MLSPELRIQNRTHAHWGHLLSPKILGFRTSWNWIFAVFFSLHLFGCKVDNKIQGSIGGKSDGSSNEVNEDTKTIMYTSSPLNISITEGESFSLSFAFNKKTSDSASVDWLIVGGSSDFTHDHGTIVVAKDSSGFELGFNTIDDSTQEPTKYLTLLLTGMTGIENSLLLMIELSDDDSGPQLPPPDPLALLASTVSSSDITLSWTSGGGSTVQYRIAYQAGNVPPADCSSGTTITEDLISGTSHPITSLSSISQYAFRVCALNGNSPPDVSSGITSIGVTDYPPDTTGPGPITWVVSPDLNNDLNVSQIFLSWSGEGIDAESGVRNYEISWYSSADCSGSPLSSGFQTDSFLWHTLQLGLNSVEITAYDKANNQGTPVCLGPMNLSIPSPMVAAFGDNGIQLYESTIGGSGFNDSLVLPNDQILVSGYVARAGSAYPLIGRLNSDGSWDTSFGGDGTGYRSLYWLNTTQYYSYGQKIDRQVDGKILQVGYSDNPHLGFIARYLSDGSLDATFGDGGFHTFQTGSTYTDLYGVHALSNGKVAAVGVINNGGNDDVIVYQFDQSGKLDPFFNGSGYMTFDISGQETRGFGITEGPDHSLLIVGDKNGNAQLFLAKITFSGVLDSSFGTSSGYTAIDASSGRDGLYDLQVLSDGKLLANGTLNNCGVLARFDSNGLIDTSFGTNGYAESCNSETFLKAYYLSTNKFVGMGDHNLVAAQFTASGVLDSGFGINGESEIFAPANEWLDGKGGGVLSTGEIVIVGTEGSEFRGAAVVGQLNSDGTPDAGFSSDGLKFYNNMGSAQSVLSGMKIRSASDKILFGFSTWSEVGWNYSLFQTDANGDPDSSFLGGEQGVFNISNNYAGQNYDQMYGFFLRSDGSIFASGYGWTNSSDMSVAQWLPSGVLDNTFNSTGAMILVQSGIQGAFGITSQADGKILLTGESGGDLRVVRLTTAGILDTSFNGTGLATTNFGSSADIGYAIAVQADGAIVTVGTKNDTAGIITRHTSVGVLDTTFNTTGMITVNRASREYLSDLYIQGDGKIVTFGIQDSELVVSRYNTDGSVDTSFGTSSGYTLVTIPGSPVYVDSGKLLVLSDGSLFLVGSARYDNPVTGWDVLTAKLTSTGAIDTSFNSSGILTVNLGGAYDEGVEAGELSDGSVVVGFRTDRGEKNDFGAFKVTP